MLVHRRGRAGATVGIGTTRPLSPAELRDTSLSGEIEDLIDWKPAVPGDYWFIPAGTVHAIGDGCRLVEIQQNSDMTYRLYDYGRPRPLHLDESMAVSKPVPYADPRCGNWIAAPEGPLMACAHFSIHKVGEGTAAAHGDPAPLWITPILGAVEANGRLIGVGDCAYIEGGLVGYKGPPSLLARAA